MVRTAVQRHDDVVYRCLFESAWHTLKIFAADKKYLNGEELGMTAILHTWGQNLSRHVHLHCLVPAQNQNVCAPVKKQLPVSCQSAITPFSGKNG